MPISSLENLHPVSSFIFDLRPQSVLDIGVGFGTYGVLSRQILDIAPERFQKNDWQTRIVGIEACEDYRTPVWDYVYDKVHVGDAQQLVPTLGRFDLALLCDVIEHFEKEAGLAHIRTTLEHAKVMIVSTPLVWMDGDNRYNTANPYMHHRSLWCESDFRPWLRAKRFNSTTGVYVLSHQEISRQAGWHSGDFYVLRRILRDHTPNAVVRAVRAARAAVRK